MSFSLHTYLSQVGDAGFRVNLPALYTLSQSLDDAFITQQLAVDQEAKRHVIVHSPADVGKLLFTERGNTAPRSSKSGKPSTSKDVLAQLSDPICPLLLAAKDTHAQQRYIKIIHEFLRGDRLPFQWSLDDAANFRIYAKQPNLMSFPPALRKCILPEEGNRFIYADYSREELCIAAWACGDQKFLQDVREGFDIFDYLGTTANIDLTVGVHRTDVKVCIYAFFYGATPSDIGFKIRLSESQVNSVLNAFQGRYPLMFGYLTSLRAKVEAAGYAEVVWHPEWVSATTPRLLIDKNEGARSVRRGVNFVISGTASMILRDNIYQFGTAWPDGGKCFNLTTHDSFLLQAPIAHCSAYGDRLLAQMSGYLGGALSATCRFGDTWYDAWAPLENDDTDDDVLALVPHGPEGAE